MPSYNVIIVHHAGHLYLVPLPCCGYLCLVPGECRQPHHACRGLGPKRDCVDSAQQQSGAEVQQTGFAGWLICTTANIQRLHTSVRSRRCCLHDREHNNNNRMAITMTMIVAKQTPCNSGSAATSAQLQAKTSPELPVCAIFYATYSYTSNSRTVNNRVGISSYMSQPLSKAQ